MAGVSPDIASVAAPAIEKTFTAPAELGANIAAAAPDVNLATNLEASLATPNAGIKDISNFDYSPEGLSSASPAAGAENITGSPPAVEGVMPPVVDSAPGGFDGAEVSPTNLSASEDTGLNKAGAVDQVAPTRAQLERQAAKDMMDENVRKHFAKSDAETVGDGAVRNADGTPVEAATSTQDQSIPESTMPPIGQDQDPSDANKAEGTAAGDKTAPENTDKAKQIQELEEKVKNKTANPEELRQYNESKKDPEARREQLTQKALSKEGLTEDEAEELGKLNNPDLENAEAAEQTQEQLAQEVEDLGTDILTRKIEGEEVSQEDMDKFDQKFAEMKAREVTGATSEQARKAVKEMMQRRGNERKSRNTEEIQRKIRELMTLELQLQMIPESVNEQRAKRDDLKKDAQAAFAKAQAAKGPERIKLKQIEYQEYMKVTIANQNIINTIHFAEEMNAKRMNLEQQVRSKLGMSNFLEYAGAKANTVFTHLRIEASDMAFAFEK